MAIVGIGTDIIEIERIETALRRSDRMARRVLTELEFDQFRQHRYPARFLAKRFAAKEAAVKAIGNGIGNGVSFKQVEISHGSLGEPYLTFYGQMQSICEQRGVTRSFISISDEQYYAVATVVLESV